MLNLRVTASLIRTHLYLIKNRRAGYISVVVELLLKVIQTSPRFTGQWYLCISHDTTRCNVLIFSELLSCRTNKRESPPPRHRRRRQWKPANTDNRLRFSACEHRVFFAFYWRQHGFKLPFSLWGQTIGGNNFFPFVLFFFSFTSFLLSCFYNLTSQLLVSLILFKSKQDVCRSHFTFPGH